MSINRINIQPIADRIAAGATILVPNNRLRDAVSHAYASDIAQRVYLTPKVQGIDVWVRESWDHAASLGMEPFACKLPISATEEIFLWIEVIENSLSKYPLLNPEETANQVSRAYQLMKQWRLQRDHAEPLRSYAVIPDIAAYLEWIEEFESLCQERDVISLVDCIEVLCNELADSPEIPVADELVLFNFYQPPPLYAELFSLLSQRTEVSEVQLATDIDTISGDLQEFSNPREEFMHVANWAKQLIEQDSQAHIGLVGELNENQRTELERILHTTLNTNCIVEFTETESVFNSTHSTHSLLDEALVYDAFLLFDLVNEEQQGEAFCRVLRSPFVLPQSDEQEVRTKLETELRRRVTSHCRLQDLAYYAGREGKEYFCPNLSTAMLAIRESFRRMPQLATPREWGQFLEKILSEFDWPGERVTPYQRQVQQRFQKALDELATLTPLLGTIDYTRLVARLRNICVRAKYQQQFSPQSQISLYSIDEASGLNFDHLWILNFNDQVWPPPISPSPFLPYTLQKEVGLPGSHSDVQHQFAESAFRILCSSVGNSLHASFHRSDGEQECRVSSYGRSFERIATDSEFTGDNIPIPLYGWESSDTPRLSVAADDTAVPLVVTEESLGGVSVLSDQSNCPFHGFLLHRLHAEPLESFATGLSRASRGTAMHEALEFLFGQVAGRDSIPGDPNTLTALCDEAAGQAIQFLRKVHQALMTPRFERIEQQRIANLLQRFLKKEKERADFTVAAREQRHSWSYRGMVFNLKIDRVDRLDDGSLAVIDYKTGKTVASPTSWLSDRPQDLQLPFYSTVMNELQQESVAAIAIAHVNPERTDYSGIMEQKQFHRSLTSVSEKLPGDMDWPALNHHFKLKVQEIADEFLQGIARISPVDYSERCSDPQIRALCRVPDSEATDETGD
ncbi:MAG: PD-(D/E)XK nuclease family protein [Pseudomonadales bacterium]|nr:PD-(D/E)XK nuclease family protein [Pseudomonadales bacterium]